MHVGTDYTDLKSGTADDNREYTAGDRGDYAIISVRYPSETKCWSLFNPAQLSKSKAI